MSQSRWDLEEHAFIGIFSFSKFIMWNDINKNAEKLKENKIVASLVSGKLEWEEMKFELKLDFDNKYHPSEIALPISADSTQLEAICAAVEIRVLFFMDLLEQVNRKQLPILLQMHYIKAKRFFL